ncbi:hypothetical protein E2C01_058069 [Portunus trituberculatus]|uniref:Secreted protein n=1 Tax=Portunus trituberculatus TaxID=210409 RepID=A0A5B7GUL9_PORTR|nr:hypothetical protein [Portunus trituberculatus]
MSPLCAVVVVVVVVVERLQRYSQSGLAHKNTLVTGYNPLSGRGSWGGSGRGVCLAGAALFSLNDAPRGPAKSLCITALTRCRVLGEVTLSLAAHC